MVEVVGVGGAVACLVAAIVIRRWARTEQRQRDRAEAAVTEGKHRHALPEQLVEDLWRAVNLTSDKLRADLFDSVIDAFARWVGELPASSEYHHSGPGGLIRHSLEAALHAVNRLRGVGFKYMDDRGQEDPVKSYEAAEVWRYAAFVFTLFHDVGKCKSFRVTGSDGRVWEPFAEPLAAFASQTGRQWTRVDFVPGRGVDRHEAFTPFMMGRILPPAAIRFLERFEVLQHILAASAGKALGSPAQENADLFLKTIKAGDRKSVERDRQEPEVAEPEAPPQPLAGAESNSKRHVGELALRALAEMLDSGELRPNTPSSDVIVGRKFVVLSYQHALDVLVAEVKKRYGAAEVRLRKLKEGREIAYSLDGDLGVLVRARGGDWKLLCLANYGRDSKEPARFDCVVLDRERLPEDLRKSLARCGVAPSDWRLKFYGKDGPVEVEEFRGASGGTYDGWKLLGAMRDAIVEGKLAAVGAEPLVYVKHPWTYFVCPAAMNALLGKEEVLKNLNDVLDALAKTGCVKTRDGSGRVLVGIMTGTMKQPVQAVPVLTAKLFRSGDVEKLEGEGKFFLDEIREVREA